MKVYILVVGDYGDNGSMVTGVYDDPGKAMSARPNPAQSPSEIETWVKRDGDWWKMATSDPDITDSEYYAGFSR